MQFFNQVKDRVVTTVLTRVKPIVLRNSEKIRRKQKTENGKHPRTPSPSSTTSISSTDPNAETVNLLPKTKSSSSSSSSSSLEVTHSSLNEKPETQTHVIHIKSLKNGHPDKGVFQSIENDLQTLTKTTYNKDSNTKRKESLPRGQKEKSSSTTIPISTSSVTSSVASTSRKRDHNSKSMDTGVGIGNYDEEYGDRLVEMKRQTTQTRVIQQDEILEDMCAVVDRLQTISHDINKELRVQSKIIEEVNEEVEDAQSSFVILGKKMDHLINTESNGFKLVVILSLIVIVLVILLVFVI